VLTSAAPLRTPDGAIFGAVATLTDITPLRKAEQALEEANAYLEHRIEERTVELADTNEQLKQALKREQQMQAQLIQSEKFAAISRLVASVAHELNNPIQTIQNCMFLLEQVIPLDDPSRDFLDMSISEAKRISKLVDQLRETYRPAKTYAAEVFDVLELLRNTQNILEPHLKQNHIQMKIKPLKEPILVNGVIDQIKQVFLNISLNAIESMQPAGGSLKVSISTVKETNMVAIVFKDNGPGISKEDLPRIFEPFFTTKPKGTGLGLPICYEIVQSHGGKIIVNSQKEEGTSFSVWLPVCQ
jgi:signal transduction histidine kinase